MAGTMVGVRGNRALRNVAEIEQLYAAGPRAAAQQVRVAMPPLTHSHRSWRARAVPRRSARWRHTPLTCALRARAAASPRA